MARNINKEHIERLTFQEKLALKITKSVGSMYCAYIFAAIALISLPDAIKSGRAAIVAWVAQTFLQLVLLSIIMVGQNVAGKRSELREESDYEVDLKNEKDIAEIKTALEEIKILLKEKIN